MNEFKGEDKTPVGDAVEVEYSRELYQRMIEISKAQGWWATEWPTRFITCEPYVMDLYKKGVGVLKEFPMFLSADEAREFVKDYCKKNGLTFKVEYGPDAVWNYLSDGTEIDYSPLFPQY